jgi:hypothetical protein
MAIERMSFTLARRIGSQVKENSSGKKKQIREGGGEERAETESCNLIPHENEGQNRVETKTSP